jgi:hypothetical protein
MYGDATATSQRIMCTGDDGKSMRAVSFGLAMSVEASRIQVWVAVLLLGLQVWDLNPQLEFRLDATGAAAGVRMDYDRRTGQLGAGVGPNSSSMARWRESKAML